MFLEISWRYTNRKSDGCVTLANVTVTDMYCNDGVGGVGEYKIAESIAPSERQSSCGGGAAEGGRESRDFAQRSNAPAAAGSVAAPVMWR